MRVLIIILVLVSIGLGVGLLVRHNAAVKEKTTAVAEIQDLSNRVENTQAKLDEQERISMFLQTNLNQTTSNFLTKSNETVKLTQELAKSQAESKQNAEAYAAAKAESDRRQTEIDKLSGTINDQTKKLTDLNSAIDGLNKQISDTERKLAASEGDREFLLKELKRLQAEKSELERQFNDLALLRAQVSKLREEMSIARRLEWIRTGLYGAAEQKGAERLLLGATPTTPPRPGLDLNVEIRQEGGATIKTNTAPPPPPK